MILAPPAGFDPTRAIRDLATAHPLLRTRWAQLQQVLAHAGIATFLNEVYRYELRQQWLFGAGRTAQVLAASGVPQTFARPGEKSVTNAWTALKSAHGCTRWDAVSARFVPASAAIDIVPVGQDGKPWTPDDPWPEFIDVTEGAAKDVGLIHFRSSGCITDKPHLQMVEWNDTTDRLEL